MRTSFSEHLVILPAWLDVIEKGEAREMKKGVPGESPGEPEELVTREPGGKYVKENEVSTEDGIHRSPELQAPSGDLWMSLLVLVGSVRCMLVWLRWPEELRGKEVEEVIVESPPFENCEWERKKQNKMAWQEYEWSQGFFLLFSFVFERDFGGFFFHGRKSSFVILDSE